MPWFEVTVIAGFLIALVGFVVSLRIRWRTATRWAREGGLQIDGPGAIAAQATCLGGIALVIIGNYARSAGEMPRAASLEWFIGGSLMFAALGAHLGLQLGRLSVRSQLVRIGALADTTTGEKAALDPTKESAVTAVFPEVRP